MNGAVNQLESRSVWAAFVGYWKDQEFIMPATRLLLAVCVVCMGVGLLVVVV